MQTQEQFEREAEKRNNTAVVFKNIDTEDFTHTYAGIPYTVKAGETMVFTYPVAMLLAEHLAMRILRKKKTGKYSGTKGDVEKTLNLYPETEKIALKEQIIRERIEQPMAPAMTDGEKEKAKITALNQKFGNTREGAPKNVTVDKKQIIDELKKRGITFNPRASKEELLALITAAEMSGK